MKNDLVSLLICPACLPAEVQLQETVQEIARGDIESGELRCPECRRVYPIVDGVADLDPNAVQGGRAARQQIRERAGALVVSLEPLR